MLGHVKTQKKTITFNAFICFIVIAATIFRFVLLWYFSWDVRNWPHDDLLQRNNAISILNGNWLGDYSNVILPKYPGFPLFLAFINRLFIPYSIGIGLIMTLSSFSFCMAISPLVKKKCDGKTEGGSDKFWRVQARPFPKEEPNIPNTAEHLRLNVTEVALGNANGK